MDFNLGMRYSYESGRPYGRLIIVRGLGQGNVTMLAEATRRLCAAGGQRLPGPRRQGLQDHRQPAAPALGRRLQHLQLGHDADAAQQQLAGDADDAVGADADRSSGRGPCSSASAISSDGKRCAARGTASAVTGLKACATRRIAVPRDARPGPAARLPSCSAASSPYRLAVARSGEWRYFGGDKAFTAVFAARSDQPRQRQEPAGRLAPPGG